MKKKVVSILLMCFIVCNAFLIMPAEADIEEDIEEAISKGLEWLVGQQDVDGSWPGYWDDIATSGLAVLKLCDRAYELGYESPFDPEYEYHENVGEGFEYLFDSAGTKLKSIDITLQDHTMSATGTIDDPDVNDNGKGIYAGQTGMYSFQVYDTSIVLSAISASGTPDRIVNVPGSVVNGMEYRDVAQDMVDWLAWAQSDYDYPDHEMGEGAWTYTALDNDDYSGRHGPDNSNSGYALLGLAYSEQLECTVPQWVKTELDAYVTDIQDPVDGDDKDGGSWYEDFGDSVGVNILKTGNLIFEMAYVGDDPETPRVLDALDYLERHWGDLSGSNRPPGWDGDPPQYQAMFTTMKGLEYMGIDTFSGIDWFADFVDRILDQQDPDGSWKKSSGRGTPVIITEWALLILEKVSGNPNDPPNVDSGGPYEGFEGNQIFFNASASDDPDGDPLEYRWDFDSDGTWDTAWSTSYFASRMFGDDFMGTVTLEVSDGTETATDTSSITIHNVNPDLIMESGLMDVEIGLRVAGRKLNDVGMTLYENETAIGYVSIERMPGSPDDQMAWIPMTLHTQNNYSAIITYTPEDPPNIGGNPVWIYIKFQDGSIKKIHHTFNVQQSKKRNSNHWNHIEPWEVDLNPHLIGSTFDIDCYITDPGSDDENITYSYGSQTGIITSLCDPPNFDQYPSIELAPRDFMDSITLYYESSKTINVQVEDDDGGIIVKTIEIP